jgi:preprotein translocase subunit SecG
MAAWIILVLMLVGLILWQRRRLLQIGDSFGGDEYRRPDGDADAGGDGR